MRRNFRHVKKPLSLVLRAPKKENVRRKIVANSWSSFIHVVLNKKAGLALRCIVSRGRVDFLRGNTYEGGKKTAKKEEEKNGVKDGQTK